MNSITYDSKAESVFHGIYPHLRYNVSSKKYNQLFTDSDNTTFRAMGDFYCEILQLNIEFKCAQLNTIKTKAKAESKLESLKVHKQITNKDILDCSWSNSMYKQKLVFDSIPYDSVIVFADKTPISSYSKNKMKDLELPFMYAKEYQALLNQALPKLLH